MRRFPRGPVALLVAALAPWACTDATDVELLEISGSAVLTGQVFLDLDGTRSLSPSDEALDDVEVELRTASTGEVIDVVTTDPLGVFILSDVALGSYRVALASSVLGDSLDAVGRTDPVAVGVGDTIAITLGASFPVLTLEETLEAPEGRRIFTSGIALNPRVNFGDGQVHFSGASGFLRALDVARSSVAPGDSVRLLGRTATDNGRPALSDVTPLILVPQAALPLPEDVSTAAAASADDEALDAALVRIRDAEISDTATMASGNFHFWADDGSDPVEVVIREFLGLNHTAFSPDTVVRLDALVGLLSPFDDGTGTIRWRMLPRGSGDVAFETKAADVAVAVSIDTAQASLDDEVEVRVIVTNAGPLAASGLQVRDTVPTAMTFVSATQTQGTYDDATGIWDIGDLAPGAADTLHVRLEVSDGTPRTFQIVADVRPLAFEVNPNTGGDNRATVALTIQ